MKRNLQGAVFSLTLLTSVNACELMNGVAVPAKYQYIETLFNEEFQLISDPSSTEYLSLENLHDEFILLIATTEPTKIQEDAAIQIFEIIMRKKTGKNK